MKPRLLLLCLVLCFTAAQAADPIIEANKCWDEKKYQCALDNYKLALSTRQYQQKDYSLIQYRVGYSCAKLEKYPDAVVSLREAFRANPEMRSAYWELAWTFYSWGKYDSAVVYYTRSASLYANETANLKKINYWKGQSYSKLQKYKDAIDAYSESYKLDSTDGYTATALGDCHYNIAAYTDAVRYYTKALELQRNEEKKSLAPTIYWRAKSWFRLRKYPEALQGFRETLDNDPTYRLAFWDIAGTYYEQGKWAEASEAYTKAIAQYKGETASLAKLYYYRGACYEGLKNFTKAMADYDLSLQANPTYYLPLWAKGNILGNQKKYKESNSFYTKVIEASDAKDSDLGLLYVHRGKNHLLLKDTVSAEKDFTQALALDMYMAEPNMELGHLSFARKKYLDAASYYSYGLEDFFYFGDSTEMALIYLRKGLSNYWVGYGSTAKTDLEYCIGYDPRNKTAHRYLAELYYGNMDYNKAESLFTQCLSLYKNDKDSLHRIYYYRGLARIEKKAYQAALDDFNESARLKPTETSYLYKAGQLQFEMKDYNKSLGTFSRLIPLLSASNKNDLATAYYCRGRCYYELDKKEEAKKDFTKALEYVPGFTECQQWLAKVK